MRLTEHHMPHMNGMELGKRYHVAMEIEPTELSTGESEYGDMMDMAGKPVKQPMRGTFKVHAISEKSKGTKPKSGRYGQ